MAAFCDTQMVLPEAPRRSVELLHPVRSGKGTWELLLLSGGAGDDAEGADAAAASPTEGAILYEDGVKETRKERCLLLISLHHQPFHLSLSRTYQLGFLLPKISQSMGVLPAYVGRHHSNPLNTILCTADQIRS